MFELSKISSDSFTFQVAEEAKRELFVNRQSTEGFAAKPQPKDSLDISSKSLEITKQNEKPKADSSSDSELSQEEQEVVDALKDRDEEVRRHEQAHLSAGGGLVRGGASFNYQVGPDGKQYAIGGEVQIDIAPEKDPGATIRKMQQVRATALAPSDPSGQDRSVAAMASKVESQARKELQSEQAEVTSEKGKTNVQAVEYHSISPQAKLALAAYKRNEYN